jgi:hypothetical protein
MPAVKFFAYLNFGTKIFILQKAHVKYYVNVPELAGLFVGQASLDADSFPAICEQMAAAMEGRA